MASVGPPNSSLAPVDSSEDVVSIKPRLCSLAASLLVLVCLVWACISERWHCFEVQVAPAEVYQMFQALTSILPDTGQVGIPSSELRKDEEPKIAFELEAGLWSTSAVNLCQPKEKALAVFVDKKQCEAKLRSFCTNILDEKPKDPMVRHFFEICEKAVHQGSVRFSLVLEPFKRHEADVLQDSDTLESLQANLERHGEDSDPDLCETLVNCELLAELRPWNFSLIALIFVTLLMTMTSTVFFVRAVTSEDPKFLVRGCHMFFLAALILVVLIALDIYIGERFAVEEIFRTEDLFYYMLPEAAAKSASSFSQMDVQELPKRLQKRYSSAMLGESWKALQPTPAMSNLQVDLFDGNTVLREIPAAKWQNALMVLCGNLMAALVSGQMSTFVEPLKEVAKRAWSKSDRVLSTWLLYLQKSLVEAPDRGNSFLNSLMDDLGTMKSVDEVCAKENCGGAQEELQALTTKFLAPFRSIFQDKIAEARALIGKCRNLLQSFKNFWDSVHEPVKQILELVVKVAESTSKEGVMGLLSTVVNALGEPELIQDLRLLFQRLFKDFPKIVHDVRALADSFVSLIQGFNTALQQLQVAAEKVKTELRQGITKGTEAAMSRIRVTTSDFLDDKMAEASSMWTVETAEAKTQELGKSFLQMPHSQDGNATAMLQSSNSQGDYPLLSILKSFATGGGLCSPAARIGSIFLSEIQHMHSEKRGFSTSRGGIFKHFGYITFGLIILTAGMLGGYVAFLLGYVK